MEFTRGKSPNNHPITAAIVASPHQLFNRLHAAVPYLSPLSCFHLFALSRFLSVLFASLRLCVVAL